MQRLYVWDYTTDFSHYVLPHPNWFVLGANVRLFQAYGVKGLFEQGAYQGYGGDGRTPGRGCWPNCSGTRSKMTGR